MPISSFYGLQTSLRGLVAQQRSIDVTGHNIANVSTQGYSRQEAGLAASASLLAAGGCAAERRGRPARHGRGRPVLPPGPRHVPGPPVPHPDHGAREPPDPGGRPGPRGALAGRALRRRAEHPALEVLGRVVRRGQQPRVGLHPPGPRLPGLGPGRRVQRRRRPAQDRRHPGHGRVRVADRQGRRRSTSSPTTSPTSTTRSAATSARATPRTTSWTAGTGCSTSSPPSARSPPRPARSPAPSTSSSGTRPTSSSSARRSPGPSPSRPRAAASAR